MVSGDFFVKILVSTIFFAYCIVITYRGMKKGMLRNRGYDGFGFSVAAENEKLPQTNKVLTSFFLWAGRKSYRNASDIAGVVRHADDCADSAGLSGI